MPNLIVEKNTDVIKYGNNDNPIMEATKIIYPDFIVLDMGTTNADLINTAIALPVDFIGEKYLWQSDTYVENPDYMEPEEPPVE